jgi:hypothetical protein
MAKEKEPEIIYKQAQSEENPTEVLAEIIRETLNIKSKEE